MISQGASPGFHLRFTVSPSGNSSFPVEYKLIYYPHLKRYGKGDALAAEMLPSNINFNGDMVRLAIVERSGMSLYLAIDAGGTKAEYLFGRRPT